MADTIQIKRGLASNLNAAPALLAELLLTTDTGKLYAGVDGTTSKVLLNPDAPVQSVSGKTGAVTLAKSDVGLANVDNTSDANKPVSTAQQTALNAKEVLLSGVAAKTSPINADSVYIRDSAASNAPKAVTITNLKSMMFTSSALTGSPTAPTPATSDNSTLLATTAFVKAQGYLTNASDITIDGGTF